MVYKNVFTRLCIAILIALSFLLYLPHDAFAASCTGTISAQSQFTIDEVGSYAIWVRYQASEDTTLNLSIANACHTISLPKTAETSWQWTALSTQGINAVVIFEQTGRYVVTLARLQGLSGTS